MLAAGVGVLVLDPVDSRAAVSIVNAANAQGVPVVAYDRMIAGGEIAYFVSFDDVLVGELQATALVDALGERGQGDGGILMVNGSPTDSNAVGFRDGARKVIDASGLRVLASYDTPGWSPDKAQSWVAGQISQFGDAIVGVYAANDATASGVIAALREANRGEDIACVIVEPVAGSTGGPARMVVSGGPTTVQVWEAGEASTFMLGSTARTVRVYSPASSPLNSTVASAGVAHWANGSPLSAHSKLPASGSTAWIASSPPRPESMTQMSPLGSTKTPIGPFSPVAITSPAALSSWANSAWAGSSPTNRVSTASNLIRCDMR